MADDMRPATPEAQCGNEGVHGEHEWLLLGAFRSQCPGYVGAVAELPATLTTHRRQYDPGALIEEPDLYEQGEGGAR